MDDIDKRVEDYNRGVKAGWEHSKPSKDTLEMFGRLEKKMSDELKEIRDDIKTLIGTVSSLTSKVDEGNKSFRESIKKLFEKHEGNDDRITKLEIGFGKITIKVAMVVSGLVAAIYFILDFIKNKLF